MVRTRIAIAGVLLVAACGEPQPPAPAAATGAPAPVARPEPAPPATPAAPPGAPATRAEAAPPAEPPVAVPDGAVYACVVDAAGERRVSAIELSPKVAALCAQNPEMGPCQYERAACRSRGGRVFAADGKEITRATEAEYDRRVLRVRINSN